MTFNNKILMLLLFSIIVQWQEGTSQQLIETEILNYSGTVRTSFFSSTYVNYGSLYKDRIELRELAAGQSGYVEFSLDHFDNADVFIGLQNGNNATEAWVFQFLDGEILLNGINYGLCASGMIYRVERCDASIKFYTDGTLLSETSLSDINFPAVALVEVNTAELTSGNAPSLSLQFPFHNNCQGTPANISANEYALLKKTPEGTYLRLTEPVLRFKYVEDYALVAGQNNFLDYNIYDWDRGLPNQSGALLKRFGVNYLQVNLSSINTNKHYTLEVEDSKGQKYFLRFYYYCPPGQKCILLPPDGIQDNGHQLQEE